MAHLHKEQFWAAINILLQNYHAVNRRIFGGVLGDVFHISQGIEQLSKKWYSPQTLQNLPAIVHLCNSTQTDVERILSNSPEEGGYLLYYKFLTKKADEQNIEALIIIDFTITAYSCHFRSDVQDNCYLDDFSVILDDGQLVIKVLTERATAEVSLRWAENVLHPKLLKWAQSKTPEVRSQTHSVKSLQLVDTEQYNDLYKQLKSKYAESMLGLWREAKECTDPLKFIYEDLAISAYLISLWRRLGNDSPVIFADLGCGNGLLVYILNQEGYRGYGFDIRARKLWPHYPTSTQAMLKEQTVEPRSFHLPPKVNWLIGNHSDELSPWLPVLAATTNWNCCYFLLPCCPYELSGVKFQRRNSTVSAYQDFFAYAKQISTHCGFDTVEDRLKIPSTKRLALVGVTRSYSRDIYESEKQKILNYIDHEMRERSHTTAAVDSTADSTKVKLREKAEIVRNCTQIDRNIIDALVLKIFQSLLAEQNTSSTHGTWRQGGQLRLQDIVQELTKDERAHIKSECGGIKTLLRNKHEIFEFHGKELIGIRKPQARAHNGKDLKDAQLRKRACFFKLHHPDGCPLSSSQCTFMH